MIFEIYTENGQKKKRALTGNGYGLPLGAVIAYEGAVPDGFLACDGSTYDTTTYSALYALLGVNTTPNLTSQNMTNTDGWCIKATPAYVEPDTVSDMVHTMRVQDSYSTEEVNTGKKWIDGKPIYSKTYHSSSGWANNTVLDTISNIGILVHSLSTATNGTAYITNPTSNGHNFLVGLNFNTHQIVTLVSGVYLNNYPCWATIEYTKTTD